MTAENQNHEQTDPRLDALLDEALSPRSVVGGVPTDLADRIVSVTEHRLGRRAGVIGRIGPVWVRYASAAGLLLAASAVLLTFGTLVNDRRDSSLASIESELNATVEHVQQYRGLDQPIDRELAQLAQAIDSFDDPETAPWNDAIASIDQTLREWESDNTAVDDDASF